MQDDALKDCHFSYRQTKDGRVLLYWQNQQVMILKGKAASRLLAKVEGQTEEAAQLAMAKVTGNFKRGNERTAKKKGRV